MRKKKKNEEDHKVHSDTSQQTNTKHWSTTSSKQLQSPSFRTAWPNSSSNTISAKSQMQHLSFHNHFDLFNELCYFTAQSLGSLTHHLSFRFAQKKSLIFSKEKTLDFEPKVSRLRQHCTITSLCLCFF